MAESARQSPNSARVPLWWFFQAGKRGQTRPAPRRWRGAGRGASAPGRDPGRILQGSWPEPSGTVRGRFGDGSRASWQQKRGQTRAATPAMARSRARGERARSGPWRDPSGKLAGSFRDGSRTIRGRFEGVLAAKARSDQGGDPGDGAEPGGGSTTICFRGLDSDCRFTATSAFRG